MEPIILKKSLKMFTNKAIAQKTNFIDGFGIITCVPYIEMIEIWDAHDQCVINVGTQSG